MKNKIYEFRPTIYPFRLWIGIEIDDKTIINKFVGYDIDTDTSIELNSDYLKRKSSAVASCLPMIDVQGYIGIYIPIYKINELDNPAISHESDHCADFICQEFGIEHGTFVNGESHAYLVQWVASCIEKVVNEYKSKNK